MTVTKRRALGVALSTVLVALIVSWVVGYDVSDLGSAGR